MTDDVANAIKTAYMYLDAAMPSGEKITRAAAMQAAQVHATLAVAVALRDLAAKQEPTFAPVRPVVREPFVFTSKPKPAQDDFAFPAVPVELRPLFIAVSNIVMEELRQPGDRADRAEVTIQNRIRHAFEGRKP